ncbi:MAG: hypothetical protein RIT81_13060 [Deltaproteobacteria bacterium]
MHESETRRPENLVTSEQIAFRLHRLVDTTRYADVPPSCYAALAEEPELAALPEPTKVALTRAAARAQVDAARDALVSIARKPTFAAVAPRAQRLFFDVLAKLPDDAAAIADFDSLIDSGLARLTPNAQLFLLQELDRNRHHGASRKTMAVLVATDAFHVLSESDRRTFITYVAGPRVDAAVVGARRSAMVAVAFAPRVRDLERFLRLHFDRRTPAKVLARQLRAYLYAPRYPLELLMARGLHHHDIVVLAEGATSYGLRASPNEVSARSMTFASPDPFIANDWQFPPRARTETYRFETYFISAHHEAALIAWLENNFSAPSCGDAGASARYSRPSCFGDGDFCRMTKTFLDSINGPIRLKSGATGFMRGGEPTTGPMSATQRLRAFFARKQAA